MAKLAIIHTTQSVGSGHLITAQAATIDRFPSVASYYSLGRWFHYSVPVKHRGDLIVVTVEEFFKIIVIKKYYRLQQKC